MSSFKELKLGPFCMRLACLSRGGPVRPEADFSVLRRAFLSQGRSTQGSAVLIRCRGTSLIINPPPPWDRPRSLGIVPL